ncbi:hypothetical protein PVK06_006431 [Gossypium arboreum]|uniref:Secreted protein n=1 Tax=Gossypium arboreum TaxID=29729 RepID=A0ABR0QEP6_GOSAR|nr:hypothetical protein PVK06_006431 [Gossypium arboreum]
MIRMARGVASGFFVPLFSWWLDAGASPRLLTSLTSRQYLVSSILVATLPMFSAVSPPFVFLPNNMTVSTSFIGFTRGRRAIGPIASHSLPKPFPSLPRAVTSVMASSN